MAEEGGGNGSAGRRAARRQKELAWVRREERFQAAVAKGRWVGGPNGYGYPPSDAVGPHYRRVRARRWF